MNYLTVTLSSKGQLVIPQEWREKLALKKGSKLLLKLNEPDASVQVFTKAEKMIKQMAGFLSSQNLSMNDFLELKQEEVGLEEKGNNI